MKKALITGITGQDGPYLARLLLGKNYKVTGTYRREATVRLDNLEHLRIKDHENLELVAIDLTEYESVRSVIEEGFDEIYNLAAQSHVGLSFKVPLATLSSTGIGAVHILEAVRSIYGDEQTFSHPKIYQASTSELFGGTDGKNKVFNEKSPFNPRSPYACAKLYAHSMMVNYREAYGMHISNGILFNHESILRNPNFVTRKITLGTAKIGYAWCNNNKWNPIEIGNINVSRDWGCAKDYVEAMYLMLQASIPSDYVVATGENHTIRELVDEAFFFLEEDHGFPSSHWEGEGLDAKCILDKDGSILVKVNPEFFRPSDCSHLTGDASKIMSDLCWRPKNSFYEMICEMTYIDYQRLKPQVRT